MQRKAVALISGGLDSMLAAKCMQEQGIHVEGINFFTGFCVEGHTHAIRQKDKAKQKRNNALWVAETLGIKLHIIDVVEEYKSVLLNPRYGYGAHLNPCLDCKVFMVSKAKEWMHEHGFDFIITGEVIGQRPMSQRKNTMPVIAKHSNADDLLVRPLSLKYLPATKPETQGWIDREKCFDFSGRSRKPQIELAKKWGIDEWSQPAGGCCFLTNQHYSAKLADLWQKRGKREYELDDILLLKVGRHIRPKSEFKMIIGREEGENNYLEGYKKQFAALRPHSHIGPLSLIDGALEKEEDILLAAKIAARYCKSAPQEKVTLTFKNQEIERKIEVLPFTPEEIPNHWYVENQIPTKVQHESA